jgi:lipopolysaccharide export system permease protein
VKLLARYILEELLVPLLVWVAFLFLLLFVMQFLRGTEVLLGSAVTLKDFARLITYLGPHFLVMALPIAFLLAILLGLGRLSEDRELTALQALGVSPLQLVRAPVCIGALLGGVMLLLAYTAEPWGLTQLKRLVEEVIKKNVVGDVKPGVFYEDLSNLTLYAEGVEPASQRWTHVLMHDDRDPASPLLVLAREGQVNTAGRGAALTLGLQDGEAHRANRSASDYAVVHFERGEIAVGVDESVRRKNRFRSPKEELTPGELLQAAREAEAAGEDPRQFLMHFHGRIGGALAPLSFALLGTPLAIGRRRGGRARGYLLTLSSYVAYYVLSRLFETQAMQGRLPVLLAAQLPNILFMGLGLVALFRLGRQGAAS